MSCFGADNRNDKLHNSAKSQHQVCGGKWGVELESNFQNIIVVIKFERRQNSVWNCTCLRHQRTKGEARERRCPVVELNTLTL